MREIQWINVAFAFAAAVLALPHHAEPTTPEATTRKILAPLLDPAKVATLKGDRPANARLYKMLHSLETARRTGGDVSGVIDQAQTAAGDGGSLGAFGAGIERGRGSGGVTRVPVESNGSFRGLP